MKEISTELLSGLGWRENSGIYTYTEVINGNKFRVGWNPANHKCYIGYGEIPVPVDSAIKLAIILEICGMHDMSGRLLLGYTSPANTGTA